MFVKLKNFLEYAFTFLVILSSGSVYQLEGNFNIYLYILMCLIILIILLSNIILKIKNITKRKIIILASLIIYFFAFIIFQKNLIKPYLTFLIPFTLSSIYVFISNVNIREFMKKFSKIIIFYSAITLVIYFFALVSNTLEFKGVVFNGEFNKVYFNFGNIFYFWQRYMIGGVNLIRNSGFFIEAGRFALMLNIAIINELFITKKINYKNIIILVITTASTFSTSGIIIMVFSICIFVTKKIERKTIIVKLMIIISFAVIFILSVNNIIGDKIDSVGGINSINTRVVDLKISYKILQTKPLIGYGFGNIESVRVLDPSNLRKESIGISNSITYALLFGGIIILIPFCIAFIKLLRIINDNTKKISIGLIILISIISQPIIFDNISIIFLSAILINEGAKKNDTSHRGIS